MTFRIVIPARYASSRLPGKPLADIGGKPMIQHVWERCKETGAADVVVATDDARVFDTAQEFGAQAVMTAADHASGTDRIAEVVDILGCADDEIIVNVQGDEPMMPPALVRTVADLLAESADAALATASHPIASMDDLLNPNVVKVVTDKTGSACYFSRSAIPHERGAERPDLQRFAYQRHIGIYAYRAGTLRQLTLLPPAPLEELEALEQLRALYHGMKIMVAEVADAPPAGVDTEKDLAAVRAMMGLSQ
ncbi:3-deoxy-manno-octulosonate cytidylyltransferase [Kordiimonas lipolytica]|uniref:3-deoxy-manno-octulosonate cytidylyltransferase n=1 Tax=Kordiimonas lipolytica TaxID=1662421 RepID=A0ABV8U7L1_9PROT|nr:3-deoxy-manno-octulosonate cytidylyltransferase [Kordiimonas lipolytica]